jgi:tripartite-type tricarboxylate transporter receptor subunit TctC
MAVRFLVLAPVALWAGVIACPALATEDATSFPSRPIHVIVPFPAGGPSDIVARVIGQKMSEDWGSRW